MHHGSNIEDAVIEKGGDFTASDLVAALHEGLTKEERNIYFAERLSSQCALGGISNYFDMSISTYYYEILDALNAIGAGDIAKVLESCKQLIFGDDSVPIDDEQELMNYDFFTGGGDEISEKLDKIESDNEELIESLDEVITRYALDCAQKGLLTRKYD